MKIVRNQGDGRRRTAGDGRPYFELGRNQGDDRRRTAGDFRPHFALGRNKGENRKIMGLRKKFDFFLVDFAVYIFKILEYSLPSDSSWSKDLRLG